MISLVFGVWCLWFGVLQPQTPNSKRIYSVLKLFTGLAMAA
ncbi:MAG: hypothetical protein JWQ30_2560, partial [Sediminibacterium sp.]|nr:hypothetical protein [Sediminibacterium sp.]